MDNSQEYFFGKDAFQHFLQMNFIQKMTYDSFEAKMLQKGIYGVLQPRMTLVEADSPIQCRLDLGAMWPCDRAFEDERCDWSWFEGLVLDLLKIQEQVCAHMLEVERIWWSWEHIFYDWQTSSAYLVYLPLGGKAWIANETLQSLLMQLEKQENFSLRRHPLFLKLMTYCKNPYFCAQGVQELIAQTTRSVTVESATAGKVLAEPLKPAFKSDIQTNIKLQTVNTKKPLILGLIQLIFAILYALCWVIIPQLTGDVGDALLGSFLLLGGVDLYVCIKFLSKNSAPEPRAQKIFGKLKFSLKPKLAPQGKLSAQAKSAAGSNLTQQPELVLKSNASECPILYPTMFPDMELPRRAAVHSSMASGKIASNETILLKPKVPKVYLVHQQTGEIYRLMQNSHRLGRNIDHVDCVLPSPTVGRQHAEIYRINQEDFLRDLDSKNGTLVNGAAIKGQMPICLSDGDLIQFGDYLMSYVKKIDDDNR